MTTTEIPEETPAVDDAPEAEPVAPPTGRADYAERRSARIERQRGRADRLRAEGNARLAAAKRTADIIPLGQPILVGHHSEKRHRRDIERIRAGFTKGFEALAQAEVLDRRADAAEDSRAISSDDPEALVKLRERLARLEAARELGRQINAAYRKGSWAAVRELAPLVAEELQRKAAFHHHDQPVPAYRLSNQAAECRRLKQRIAGLEQYAARGPKPPESYGDIRIEETDNRVLVFFPDKPAQPVRRQLKQAGFRWAPTVEAWSRMASDQAWYQARTIAKQLSGSGT